MKGIIKRFWPILAMLAGALLVWFEVKRSGGVDMDNWFWVVVGGLVVVLGGLNLLGVGKDLKPVEREDDGPRDLGL